jgi:RimJ/RimL family protein N-acetyltransferase
MGVDISKLPDRAHFEAMLEAQLNTPVEMKMSYCLIWEADGIPVGHCNTNPTSFGDHAFMHLHIWREEDRLRGFGSELVKRSLNFFFNDLKIETLISQPHAMNMPANRTLEKSGFEFQEELITIPGSINFEQPVKRWIMTRKYWEQIMPR